MYTQFTENQPPIQCLKLLLKACVITLAIFYTKKNYMVNEMVQ